MAARMQYRRNALSTRYSVEIRDLAHGGAGVGSCVSDGDHGEPRTWFIPGTLPGELVAAEVTRGAKRHVWGRTLQVLRGSESRSLPACELDGQCGGCGWQHIAVERQAQHKADIVRGQLRRVVSAIDEVFADEGDGLAYRRRARQHFEKSAEGSLRLGYRRAASHDIVDIPNCPVLEQSLDKALKRARSLAAVLPASGELAAVTDGQRVILGIVARPTAELQEACRALLDDELVGVVLRGGRRRVSIGRARLAIDRDAAGRCVHVGPFGFAQAQSKQNAELVNYVDGQARAGDKTVLELFCGAGNFTRSLAAVARRLRACDSDPEAIHNLRKGLSAWRPASRCRVDIAPAEQFVAKLDSRSERYDVVVLDPPRAGLGSETAAAVARLAAERVVYVSCDPATLARDLQVMVAEGLEVERCAVFDFMPMTPVVETVVTLRRPDTARSDQVREARSSESSV